jgi:Fe-S cluster assembly protein SufD
MEAEAQVLAEEKELAYRTAFEALERERPKEPLWLRRLRQEAMERFTALGFPAPGSEAWKYTSVAPIAGTRWKLAPSVEDPTFALSGDHAWKLPDTTQIVFVNGHFSPALSTIRPVESCRVASLRESLESRPEALEPHLGRHADWKSNPFAAWNTAFFQDGVFLRLAAGAVIPDPIHLVFLSEEAEEPSVSHPRILLVAEKGSQAAIVETYLGAGRYLTNAVTEIVAGDGAVLDHYKVQSESASALHVQAVQVSQKRSSGYTSHNLALGAQLARTDLSVLLGEPGGECTLNGLFVGNGSQHLDNHTLIDHASPHCTSRELYKGILDGKSRGVFHGKIIVRPDAQKTDAMQTNKNLLLSREALVNSTPALEILADDVKCRHGSTIGQLDPTALFYLRSRGISAEDARALLVYGFAADLAGRIRIAPIREGVEAFLGLRLRGAAGISEIA